ncbi:MAG: helix-turn-helix transcriptional regulator [Rhodobacteraceae bacterium]|nr:helix-turn-helix transcriptional regulator [Paracoccaceae bacterium]
MEDVVSLVLYGMTAGASVVAALSLGRRWRAAVSFAAGAATALLLVLTALCNAVDAASAEAPLWVMSLSGAASAGVFVTAWVYARDLSSDVPRPLRRREVVHFLVPMALLAHALWAVIAYGGRAGIDLGAQAGLSGLLFGLSGLVLLFAWLVHVTAYSAAIILTLLSLPRRLKLVFADTGGRDLIWLRAIIALLMLHIPVALTGNLGLLDVPELFFALLSSVLGVLFASWSVHQNPVFQLTHGEKRRIAVDEDAAAQLRYAKSLLGDERMAQIARRIEAVFAGERMHLTPNLSLARLAATLGVSEGHLSQTFSRHLKCTFFDYVNRWRVEEAKRLLGDPEAIIAQVGVDAGYNSRSAFYSAFREATGITPAAYRDRQVAGQGAAEPDGGA